MSRPSKYTSELLEKAEGYIEKYEELDHLIPSHVGLANYLGISRRCIYEWAEDQDKKEFLHILDDISQQQELILVSNGLSGKFNSNITKLVLGKHGYHDKQDTNLGGQDGNPIDHKFTIEVVDAKDSSPS